MWFLTGKQLNMSKLTRLFDICNICGANLKSIAGFFTFIVHNQQNIMMKYIVEAAQKVIFLPSNKKMDMV